MNEREEILRAAAEAAQAQITGNASPNVIQPQPVPMSISVSPLQSIDGKKFVVLHLFTPTGSGVYFFEPEGAEVIANKMLDVARLARTGLEIAGGL